MILMKRKLILHVGMGKTGSSSIQKTLRMAGPQLESVGIKYVGLMLEHIPRTPRYDWQKAGGWPILIKLDHDTATEQLINVLKQADVTLPQTIDTFVWSNESLFEGGAIVHDALEAVRGLFDIDLVGYIRRPDSWITSAYLQWGIKHKSYVGPLKSFRDWSDDRLYSVVDNIESWEPYGDNVHFFNFDAIDDVTRHFLELYLPHVEKEVVSSRENETPPPVGMALFAYYNSLFDEQVLPSELAPLLHRSGVLEKYHKVRPYNNLLPSQEDVGRYIEHNAHEIRRVNEYFSEHGQPEFELSELKVKDYSSNQQDINRALLKMIKYLSLEVASLNNKLEKLSLDR